MILREILEIERERVRKDKIVAKTVYERMKNIIIDSAKNKNIFCTYKIPEFIYGYPPIETEKIKKYLIKKLQDEGFVVRSVTKDEILIVWPPEVIRELDKNESQSVNLFDERLIESFIVSKNKSNN